MTNILSLKTIGLWKTLCDAKFAAMNKYINYFIGFILLQATKIIK